jgi:ribonuclease HI
VKHEKGSRKGSVNTVKKLTTTQRAGALAVTGGLRTTPTDTLDAHASLLPMEGRVSKFCHSAITRMATLLREHPLYKPVKRSAKGNIRRHCSPLHTLAGVFGINPEDSEKIPPVHIHPKEQGSQLVHTDIPSNKEASKEKDKNAREAIRVYSNGSAHNGKVGAAAILKRVGQPDHTLKIHLGLAKHHTVYKAELAGMLLGMHLIKTERRNKVKCVVNVDNQAALRAVNSDMTKPGQHIAAAIHKIIKQLIPHTDNGRFKLTFRWSAGHVGIEGNEEADKEAKKAAA